MKNILIFFFRIIYKYKYIVKLILTKLDGTAKGGAIISVRDKFNNLPIKYVCTGESLDDICEFSSDEFVDSILSIMNSLH